MLKFSSTNAKLGAGIWTFSLPAGHSCPFAHDCLSKADRKTGHIKDGKHTQFRCFAASGESSFPNVRKARWHNFNLLAGKDLNGMVELISKSLPKFASMIRIHVSGDFFSQTYFDAWNEVAKRHPNVTFYAYTKALPHWVKRFGSLSKNFLLTASKGGTHDKLINEFGLKYAEVVYSEKEASDKNLDIDHDDSHAYTPDGKPFALLIHGTQPAGTPAAKAMSALRAEGKNGYGRKK